MGVAQSFFSWLRQANQSCIGYTFLTEEAF